VRSRLTVVYLFRALICTASVCQAVLAVLLQITLVYGPFPLCPSGEEGQSVLEELSSAVQCSPCPHVVILGFIHLFHSPFHLLVGSSVYNKVVK
jgi:hypothetical protein